MHQANKWIRQVLQLALPSTPPVKLETRHLVLSKAKTSDRKLQNKKLVLQANRWNRALVQAKVALMQKSKTILPLLLLGKRQNKGKDLTLLQVTKVTATVTSTVTVTVTVKTKAAKVQERITPRQAAGKSAKTATGA